MANRPFDIILFGATGFTGLLVAKYLSEKVTNENFRWAIAGRNKDKLTKLKPALSSSSPDIITAETNDFGSLSAMAKQARCIMTTVGPFDLYGDPLVKACIENGTHYLDITGEPLFVTRIQEQFHQLALERKVCIVNCCGFDSIPADYGAWLTAKALPKNKPVIVQSFYKTNAAFSGGTWTTAIHAIHKGMPKKKARKMDTVKKDQIRLNRRIHKSLLSGQWAIPMPVVDHWIVKKSSRGIRSTDYGNQFAYAQYFSLPSLIKVLKLILPLSLIFPAVRIGFLRKMLLNRLKPGEGPSVTERKKFFFKATFHGSSGDNRATTTISGADPGYDETAKMFSEAAFSLLEKENKGELPSGVLTTVEAMGETLSDRLRLNGIAIETKAY